MPQRSKLPPEEKVRWVEQYLAGKCSIAEYVKTQRISKSTLRDWIRLYESEGPEVLIPRAMNKKYTTELKERVVKEYLGGGVSLYDLCRRYQISQHEVVRRWVKKYTSHEELKAKSRGSEVYMTDGRSTTYEERVEIVEFCITNGMDYRATIEKYQISYQQIYSWIRKYEKYGEAGLADHRGKRKEPDKMTEVDRLRAEIKLKEAQNIRLRMENDLLKKVKELERWRG